MRGCAAAVLVLIGLWSAVAHAGDGGSVEQPAVAQHAAAMPVWLTYAGLDEQAAEDLQAEAVQVRVNVGKWLELRRAQADRMLSEGDLSLLGTLAWDLFVIIAMLALMRLVLRRWDEWMTGAVQVIGQTMPIGGWTLFLVRVVELFRAAGPALIGLVTTLVIYRWLGAKHAPPEVQVAFILAFWLTAMRFQLRFLEALVQHLATRAEERATRKTDRLEHDDEAIEQPPPSDEEALPEAAMAISPAPTPDEGSRSQPPDPVWQLFSRTWRLATRYVSVVIILLALFDYAMGHGVAYGLLRRFSWWAAVPIAIYALRTWRPLVVREYLRRSDPDSPLSQITERHAQRFYGVFVVAVALVIVLARQIASFVRRNLSDLDSTKRVLAFLFRRGVEKNAHEHGRVLESPHVLPDDLIEFFPADGLDPSDRPVKRPCIEELCELFTAWQEHHTDGSVVLVGENGMGKTTVLRMLERELEEPVVYAKLITKITTSERLVQRLARLLELGDEPTDERDMIRMLYDSGHRVIALDNCHHLFLRTVGGFDAWESFTRIVNETCDHIFWVVSCNATAWDYLGNIASRVSYFRRVVELPPWSDEDLRRLILTRMRRARYRISFTDLLVTKIDGVKASTRIIGTSHGYFRLLWDFTDGNPRLAGHFWLRSLVPEDERRRVRVHLFSPPPLSELEELPDNILFVLVAVAEHENVTPDELTTITNFSPDFCRFALRFGRERGYLWRHPTTGRTYLSFYWQQSIVRFLKRQHLLYS